MTTSSLDLLDKQHDNVDEDKEDDDVDQVEVPREKCGKDRNDLHQLLVLSLSQCVDQHDSDADAHTETQDNKCRPHFTMNLLYVTRATTAPVMMPVVTVMHNPNRAK